MAPLLQRCPSFVYRVYAALFSHHSSLFSHSKEVEAVAAATFSPILVFHLKSGTPPYLYFPESTVESLASLRLSLRLKLNVLLIACFVQFNMSRVVWLFLMPIECKSLP